MFRLFAIVLLMLCCGVTCTDEDPPKSTDGPFAVETADDLTLKDATRKKDLSYKVYFPKPNGTYPVLLFSHGFGGNKDAFGPIGKHWASHGYIVIHPSHDDGFGRQRSEEKKDDKTAPIRRPGSLIGGLNGGLVGALNEPKKIEGRIADLVLILDSLDDLPKSVPALKGKIDKDKVGVAGHSFGAYTAMLIGGVTADLGGVKNKSFLDKRVKCVLAISGQGTGQQGLTEKSWGSLQLPFMTITGTRDRGAGGQGVEWKKEPYKYSPPGEKFLVVIDGANHMSFGGGLGARGSDITNVVKLATTHFWDAYLKDSESAKKYLLSDRITKETAGKCSFEKK
jgi:predicted dienelactone hydrolase